MRERCSMRKQLFLSHTWTKDSQNRDTHERARVLKWHLQTLGWTVWFDESEMKGNIEGCMSQGIEQADAVIILLTRAYARKVNRAALETSTGDNCLKEFNYAHFMRKLIIPVVFEDNMKCIDTWSPGIVPMRLSMQLYVDGASDDMDRTALRLGRTLAMHGKFPSFHPKTRHLFRKLSRSTIIQLYPCRAHQTLPPPRLPNSCQKIVYL